MFSALTVSSSDFSSRILLFLIIITDIYVHCSCPPVPSYVRRESVGDLPFLHFCLFAVGRGLELDAVGGGCMLPLAILFFVLIILMHFTQVYYVCLLLQRLKHKIQHSRKTYCRLYINTTETYIRAFLKWLDALHFAGKKTRASPLISRDKYFVTHSFSWKNAYVSKQ